MIVKCKQCNEEFNAINTELKRGGGKFCSLPCYWKFGRQFTKEHRRNLSIAFLGRKMSEETKRKMSLAKKGKQYAKGKHWKMSIEDKEKCRKRGLERVKNGTFKNQWGGYKGGYERKLWHNRRRYLLKKGIVGLHTLEEWQELKKKYDYTCLCCYKQEPEITLSEDHIIPITKGGTDNIENIQPLCRHCNSRKYNKYINYIKLLEPIKVI